MRVIDRIHLVGSGVFGLSHYADCNVYAIDCDDYTVVIDSGCGIEPEHLLANIRADGLPDVGYLLLTHAHWDHARGSDAFARAGAKVIAHAAAVPELRERRWANGYAVTHGAPLTDPVEVDTVVDADTTFTFGPVTVRALVTPGHSPESLCFRVHTSDDAPAALFTGDTVMGEGKVGASNLSTNFVALSSSLGRLAEEEFDALFPGHHAFTVRGGPEQVRLVREIVDGPWMALVPGRGPFLPTWWLQRDPRQITGWYPEPGGAGVTRTDHQPQYPARDVQEWT